MAVRCLGPLGALLILTAVLRGEALPFRLKKERCPRPSARRVQAGYVMVPEGEPERLHAIPYYPKAGDILLYDDLIKFHHLVFKIAGTGPPTHSALVFEREDHIPVLLELTGPSVARAKVVVMEVAPRLESYVGIIMVRRPRQPLTPQQSADLTQFALAQQGKNIAFKRGLLQITPFRARSGLRRVLFGRTHMDRRRWFCSEITVAACCAAHILDPESFPANSMYPRDLAFDETFDLSSTFQKAVKWTAVPNETRPAEATDAQEKVPVVLTRP